MDLSQDRTRGSGGDCDEDHEEEEEEEDNIISNINRPAQTHICSEQLMISLNLFLRSSVCVEKIFYTCLKQKLSFHLVLHLHWGNKLRQVAPTAMQVIT